MTQLSVVVLSNEGYQPDLKQRILANLRHLIDRVLLLMSALQAQGVFMKQLSIKDCYVILTAAQCLIMVHE